MSISETSNVAATPALQGQNTAGGDGVQGDSASGEAVVGVSKTGRGVHGVSQSWQGVYGESQTNAGVVGEATKFHGIFGVSHDVNACGVYGTNDAKGFGVTGVCPGGRGVQGDSTNGEAVVGVSQTGRGVHGISHSWQGVYGESQTNAGVVGEAAKFHGIFGVSHDKNSGGLYAHNDAGGFGVIGIGDQGAGVGVLGQSNGSGPGVLGQGNGSGPGVFGKANGDAGVIGFHGDPQLQETTVANDGAIAGVFGASDVGSGVVGYSRNPATPAVFAFGGIRAFASTHPFAGLFDGNVQVNGDIFVPGADCAEHFEIAAEQRIDPGTVVVIDEEGKLRPGETAYDRKVAGVISGAGGYRPGLVLDKQETDSRRQPLALVGKVFCKADASYAPIAVGDLLTSSPTSGHAMKADDPQKAFGAVLGKSLDNLHSGTGLVRVLVCLQ